ncbi:hypothetical protein H0H81_007673 [Sphagnurus paluster]|uniref:Uncharacterized protein n=1 Tax=Sphagnurus paluster TaxID=117069 RepID=A0A9P7FUJ1_9AGAR|nr:hypothetical protein H0H81_007673 [Sphagnurus paluster]
MPRLAVSSSPEEWATKGKELFERKKFLQAKHCYERAQMPRAMAISNAYYLREQARKSPLGDSRRIRDERNNAFTRAAEAFLICTNDPSKNRSVYFRRAAECFEAGADNLRAAHTYVDAHEYDAAAKLYRKLGLFDEAVAIIKANEEHMHSDVVESIKDVARLYYFREDKLQKARELFSTDEEELEYLEDLDLDVARAEVLVSLGRPAEAAELHLSEGRTLDAIPLFLKDSNNVASMRQASHCILQEFWRHLSFGVIPTKTTIVVQLLDWSLLLNRELLETKDFEEITMFKAIVAYEGAELAKLGSSFLRQNTRCAVLCLHHYFQNFPRVTGKTVLELGNILSLFLAYIGILYDLAFRVDPRVAPTSVHKLFGIQRSTADEYLVPAGTFFHLPATISRRSQLPSDLGVSISGWDFCQIFKRAICEHLSQRIAVHDDLWRHVPQLSPCLTFVTSAYCNRVACPKEHTPASSLSIEWYNARVRITLQQVLILQSLHFVRNGGNGDSERKKRHILDSKIPINVSVLCDFIEYLCASLAASAVCARGSFHSLALPRSWLYRQIREPEKAKGKDTQSRLFLVVTMAALLETMYTGAGAEHLLFENRDLSAIAGIRGIFIARICRALCLLGYNANNAFLKSNIWKTITSLYRGDRKFSAPYQQYVSSRRWEDLVRALRNSFHGVLVDEFVQLHCAKWGPPKAAPGVRLIVYENDYDLVRLLVGRNSSREAAQDQNREIEPTIHMNQSTHDIKESYVEENAEILEEETQNTDDDLTEPQPLANQLSEIENLPVISSSDMARPPTAEERQAALVIQHAYKRKLLHRRQEAKKGLSASRARKFSACLEAAQNLHWKSSIYRMHFLGPLPHLLLCLEISYDAAVIHKKGLKKLLISESHERLEGLGLRLTELGYTSLQFFIYFYVR